MRATRRNLSFTVLVPFEVLSDNVDRQEPAGIRVTVLSLEQC